jgi:peptidoglycan hydrolase-like protein with peptidoglycan-binding domain
MKKIAIALTLIIAAVPCAASAKTSDEIIAALYAALGGTVTSTSQSSTTTVPLIAPIVTQAPVVPSPVIPAQPVLTSAQLFSVDGGPGETDSQIAGLQALLASLMSQFTTLAARVAPGAPTASSSTVATSTVQEQAPAPTKKFLRDLTIGSKGDDVKQLQQLLIARGFLYGEVTGYFGILTKTALLAFQTDQGLPSVGTVGPRTRALLNSIPLEGFSGIAHTVQSLLPQVAPFTASSTSLSMTASSTSGTSTAPTGSSTPLYWGPPVSVSMSILPPEAPIGGSVAVTWLSQNADTCVASDGWDGSKPTIGAARIEPLQFSLNLVLTCTGEGGVASTSALVVVGGEQ